MPSPQAQKVSAMVSVKSSWVRPSHTATRLGSQTQS